MWSILGLAFSVGWILDIPAQHIQRQWQGMSPSGTVFEGTIVREGRVWLLDVPDQRRRHRLQVPTGLVDGRLHEGDQVVVSGWVFPPEAARNPGSFDERSWMNQNGWALTMVVERIHVIHDHSLNQGWRARWKSALGVRIDTRFEGDDVRALVRAMVLADRSMLTSDLESTFRRVGLMHLLAVSGLHFGCIVLGVWLLAGAIVARLPVPLDMQRRAIALLVLFSAFGYASLIGWSPSVVRAFLMLGVASICQVARRKGWMERSLLISALCIAFIQPEQWYSVGTRLSFAAVAGIALGLRFDRWTMSSRQDARWPFQSAIIVSTSAFIGTLPVLLWHMGWVPLMGLLVSPPAIALTAVALLLAIAAVALPAGGHAVGLLASKGMNIIMVMAESAGAARFPDLIAHSTVDVVAALLVGGAGTLWMNRGLRLYWKGCAAIVFVSVAVFIWMRPVSPRLVMLDVGQGDALILDMPGFAPVVIDTGPGARSGLVVARALRRLGYREARLVLTHGDRDHVGGQKVLDQEISLISTMAPWVAEDPRPGQPYPLLRGKRLDLPPSIRGYLLHPDTPGRDNHHSVVLLLVRGEHGILLTGDADERAEMSVSTRYGALFDRLDTRILKVAHHGSITSTGAPLLEKFPPDLALISAGRDNQFGHPDSKIVDRLMTSGARVLQTGQQGAIRISGFGDHVRIHGFLRGRWRRIPDRSRQES